MRISYHSTFCVAVGALSLALLVQPAAARDGFAGPTVRSSHGFSAAQRGRFGRVHLGGFHRRGLGVYLDRDRDRTVDVVVNQSFGAVPAAPSPFYVPSLFDLPVVAGIRSAPPSQAAVYVLNEPRAAQPAARRSSGPRIIEADPSDGSWNTPSGEPFGARIIHLAVPVGARD